MAAPTLTVTDNADGTGAVATLAGGTVGATNIVYYQPVNGQLGSATWSVGGFRTGNGTVSLSLATGFYWFHCLAVEAPSTLVSNFVYLAVTNGTDPIHERILDAVQARIQGLALSGVPSGQVYVRKVPWTKETTFPCVQVAPIGVERIQPNQGTNVRDDIGYPVLVVLADTDDQKQQTNRARNLLWRHRVIKAFRSQRLTGVSEVHNCTVEPQAILPPSEWRNDSRWIGALVLRFVTREARGT